MYAGLGESGVVSYFRTLTYLFASRLFPGGTRIFSSCIVGTQGLIIRIDVEQHGQHDTALCYTTLLFPPSALLTFQFHLEPSILACFR